MDTITAAKLAIATFLAGLTAFWGWCGWLLVVFVFVLLLDWLTGSAAAAKNGEWESSKSRAGGWHKLGCIIAVTAAGICDILIGLIIEALPAVQLPFTYSVFFFPLVLMWYILTELGSIVENAGKMGADLPEFLVKAIKVLKSTIEKKGDDCLPKE